VIRVHFRDGVPVGFEDFVTGFLLDGVMSFGRPTGLAVARVASPDTTVLELWMPRVIDEPRYLIESRAARDGNSFQPVFVSSLTEVSSPIWSGSIWALPPDVELRRGAFVFTTTGAWAGLVSEHDGRPAIVPGELVLRMADRLLGEGLIAHGLVGILVQSMDSGVAAAPGTSSGVIVTWVDRDGPASGRVSATDVIETVDGEPVLSAEHWRSRIDRIRAPQRLLCHDHQAISILATTFEQKQVPARRSYCAGSRTGHRRSHGARQMRVLGR
jgi:hypothetical protein